MSGDETGRGAFLWRWAHILWQRKRLRMEDFVAMNRNTQLAYIASEMVSFDNPQDASERILRALTKKD